MISLEELAKIREENRYKVSVRPGSGEVIVVVGMATCGISAGAKPVYDAILKGIEEKGLGKVTVKQTGCIGICQYEPVVEVFEDGKEKTTYVKMDAEKAARVVEEHLAGGEKVTDYLIGNTKL